VIADRDHNLLAGLTAAQAQERLMRDGFNELPAAKRLSHWALIAEIIREPMFALLIGAALLYAVIGGLGEAAILLAFASISVSIAIVQRGRSEKALDALRDLTSPRALVIRDGTRIRIPGREVAQGDVVVISEGDRVPADGVLVSGDHIEIDESLLTGESFPVHKTSAARIPETLEPPGGPDSPQVFSGTLVIRGTGLAVILATGTRSAIGTIGQSLNELASEQPRLQLETRRMVMAFGIVGGLLSLSAFLLYGWLRGNWIEALLGGIALGMSMLPEEFPLVLTVFMVMGARRLSQKRVLTRRASAIETLGAATVLCTDKTGTLTRNLMSVAHLRSATQDWDPSATAERIGASPSLAQLLHIAALASDSERLDPMERSLAELRDRAGAPDIAAGELLREYPLRADFLAVTRVWSGTKGGPALVAAKGAPETIAQMCGLPGAQIAEMRAQLDALAQRGMRVLAVAYANASAADLPTAPSFAFQYLGLVGFADPLRESVPGAIRECQTAGIRVVMITGDHPATARAIAHEAGIDANDLCAGDELRTLDDGALAKRVHSASVFARISPDQKLRIVNALKRNGEIVAMTGDGVNDAPALKAAHIGIAMGGRGTDVAREAASIVLLDDDFGSIVGAVRLGRRIYDNLRKAMGYILAIHVPIAGLALLPVLFGWPLILTPMLIALLELIIDPACSVVLEAEREEGDVMSRPPRRSDSRLLSRALIGWSLLQGALALAIVATVYIGAIRMDQPHEDVRALAFVSLVGVNIALIFVNRTFTSSLRSALFRPNKILWWGLGAAGGVIALILSWSSARQFFGLGQLHGDDLGVCLAATVISLLVLELAKTAWRQRLTV
jgi:P-type Ca2+ transporter type 2C